MIDLTINFHKFSFVLKNKNKKNTNFLKKKKEKRERSIISSIGIVFYYQIRDFGFKFRLYTKSQLMSWINDKILDSNFAYIPKVNWCLELMIKNNYYRVDLRFNFLFFLGA